ncbi:leucine-rich repeat flightless-interacting protein 2 isoform X31 [Sander lucioperca]|uniref:leucine-rich repeat flightless-interacting protein 2 isoform X31 n=1 Tax=Sander lucioperca TaxID=283035 RepID=UPI00125D125B|nr:leucine-rich repeat flightless-interacting protein 2 isoform X31 [Sander lucioperca]
MGTQGTGRKRSTKKERSTAEDDALNLIAREAEARLAAKRAARAEAREIRMKELERQQKELSDDDERMSVGSRGSVRSDLDAVGAYGGGDSSSHKKSKKKKKHKHKDRNGCEDDYSVISSRSSRLSDESRVSRSSRLDLTGSRLSDDTRVSRASRLDLQPASYASSDLYGFNGLSSSRKPGSTFNGYQSALYEDCSGSQRVSSSHPLEYTSYRSSGSRVSSRAGSARASPVVEDRDYLEKGSRAASALTAATLTSLGGTSSRRGSGETAITVDAETSIREIKDVLVEVEEKYRKAMVSNAQLDNEKNNLMYQVDTLKDSLMELEELLSESRRGYEEKVKEYEREKHAHSVLQFQFSEMKETLKQSEELLNDIRQLRMKQEGFVREISDLQETVEWKDKKIGALERQKEYTDAIRIERDELREEVVQLRDILKKHGIVLGPDLNINGEVGETEVDGSPSADAAPQPAQDSHASPAEGNSMLEIRLRKLVDEREKMIEQVKKLKSQLDQKTPKNGTENSSSPDGEILENGNDPNIIELQRDANRQISDFKFKLVKAEQEVTALEQNVTRLEGQVTRYKSAAENAEKVEDELKAEKRKLQRELRSALDKVDELESNNSHLSKRLDKMKTSRGMAQTP